MKSRRRRAAKEIRRSNVWRIRDLTRHSLFEPFYIWYTGGVRQPRGWR